MPQTAVETLDSILEDVHSAVDDPELGFKLRTARQLVLLLETELELGQDALADADIDADTRDKLQRLGYLD